jgi:hypothetical protein
MMDYVQLTLPYSSLGDILLYEVLYRHVPRVIWTWRDRYLPTDDLNIEEAYTYTRCNREALEYTRSAMQSTQARILHTANQHQRPVDFDVGDSI